MAHITLQVLDGADRGRIFENLNTPLTIGREEGNGVQLNDERVSRYHLKIQEDHEKIVLTDLESTNGTKVNGEEIQLRILRFGDMISLGRSVLLFGSREQIAKRLAGIRGGGKENGRTYSPGELSGSHSASPASLDFELNWQESPDAAQTLHELQPPELPERLTPGQAAQLSELLEYLHIKVRQLIASGRAEEGSEQVTLDARRWQGLLDLQWRLAGYLKEVAEPGEEEE